MWPYFSWQHVALLWKAHTSFVQLVYKQQKILSLSIPSASHKRKESLCSEVRRYPSPQGHLSGAVSYRGPSFSGWGYRTLQESLSEEKAGIWPLELSLPRVWQAGSSHRTLAGGTVVRPAGLGAWARKGCTWDEEGWGRRLSKGSFPHCFVVVVYGLHCVWLSGWVMGKYRPLALKGRDLGARLRGPWLPRPNTCWCAL